MADLTVNKTICPLCGRATIKANAIAQTANIEDAGLWYHCSCGIIFNSEIPNHRDNKEDIKVMTGMKEYPLPLVQSARVYAPLIEELTLSRKMLDVGFQTEANMDFFKERGWVPFGIDNNKYISRGKRIIKDNFETYENFCKEEFDLVWMGHVVEKFKDPIKAILHARTILKENGVLFLSTPDIDFLFSKTFREWQHWDKDRNYIMFNETSIKRELERMGFKVIMSRRNYFSRFGHFHDIHLIAQKVYF